MTRPFLIGSALLMILMTSAVTADESLVQKGIRLSHAGHWEDALDTLRQAVQQDKTNAAAHTALGMVAMENKRFDEARSALEKAVELDPKSKTALFSLALLYEKLRLLPQARSAWERFLALGPEGASREMAQRHLERLR